MSEPKSLQELWDEVGGKPFDAMDCGNDHEFHCSEIIGLFAVGYERSGTFRSGMHNAKDRCWRLIVPAPKLVPYYACIDREAIGCLPRIYLASEEQIKNLGSMHKIAEWPPVILEEK